MATKLSDFDVAGYLRNPEELAAYVEACIAESGGNALFAAKAPGDSARAKEMSEIAQETGLGREGLYKVLSADGNPQLDTLLKVA